jgi:hypothetical protein
MVLERSSQPRSRNKLKRTYRQRQSEFATSKQQSVERRTDLFVHHEAFCGCCDQASPSSGCFSGVPMMQPAEDRDLSDRSILGRFDGSVNRTIFVERQMSPVVVVVGHELTKNAQQVAFVEDDDVVESVSSASADHSFAEGILPGRPRRAENLFDAHVFDAPSELAAIDAIAIADEILGRGLFGERFDDLLTALPSACSLTRLNNSSELEFFNNGLGGPLCRGRIRDVEVKDLSAVMVENEENEEDVEGDRPHGKEINRHHFFGVIGEKSLPGLRCGLSALSVLRPVCFDVAGDRSLGYVDAEFQKFAVYPRRSPARIGQMKLLDEGDDLI